MVHNILSRREKMQQPEGPHATGELCFQLPAESIISRLHKSHFGEWAANSCAGMFQQPVTPEDGASLQSLVVTCDPPVIHRDPGETLGSAFPALC